MQSYRKILVVLDGYEEPAGDELPVEVGKALRLAGDMQGAEIVLLICGYEKFLHDSYYSFGDELQVLREEHCKRLEQKLSTVVKRLQSLGCKARSELVWGHPRYEQIVSKAHEYSVDLVIQRTRSYSRLARTFLSNDSWQLVRFCPSPLLLVKDRPWKQASVIIAGVDPVHSHHKPLNLDGNIIDSASSLGAQLGGEVHVLHAYQEPGQPFALPDRILQAHSQAFEGLLASYDLPSENCHLVDESPVLALQSYENRLGSDIIVMGALSRSRLSDALIGNTAEKVLDYLESDVLIIKPQAVSH